MRIVYVAVNELGRRVGDSHHNSVLTDHQCELVRTMREEGETYSAISAKMEVGIRTVRDILTGRRRSQVATTWKLVRVKD